MLFLGRQKYLLPIFPILYFLLDSPGLFVWRDQQSPVSSSTWHTPGESKRKYKIGKIGSRYFCLPKNNIALCAAF
jgi:hypothetical protein